MPRKRSRASTEQRFQDAVVELLGESGCTQLGINSVAQRAGSDKVLIYRYFGDLESLLSCVAESRLWLPTATELLANIAGEPIQVLKELSRSVTHHIRMDAATHQLSLWRHVAKNPLTARYNTEWTTLWEEIPRQISARLNYEARRNWTRSCALLALSIQSDLAGEVIPPQTLETLAKQLESIPSEAEANFIEDDEDTLPTNLL